MSANLLVPPLKLPGEPSEPRWSHVSFHHDSTPGANVKTVLTVPPRNPGTGASGVWVRSPLPRGGPRAPEEGVTRARAGLRMAGRRAAGLRCAGPSVSRPCVVP